MSTISLHRVSGAAVIVLTIAGCSMLIPPNVDPGPLPGGRRWIIEVDNQFAQPASLLVAVDGAPGPATNIGPTAAATPSTVPPFSKIDVTNDVPAGTGWAIFVNPTPRRPAHSRVTSCERDGKLPVTINIDPRG
jgi:hypothetical protein